MTDSPNLMLAKISRYMVYTLATITVNLVPRLSWEGKESLVTTICACAKISIFYQCAIHGLLEHVIVNTMLAKLETAEPQ